VAQASANQWSIPAVIDAVSDAVPERDMLVWEGTRRTFAEVRARTHALARFFVSRGLGIQRERGELERWECGQSRIALVMSNCPEYVEALLAGYRARAVPFNVNQNYRSSEIADLFEVIGTDAVVYHRRFAPLLAAVEGVDTKVLVVVEDGSAVEPIPGSVGFEDAIAAADAGIVLPVPSADDIYLVCTGGTTGRPKGVLWRHGDIYLSAMAGPADATEESLREAAATGNGVWFATTPLMPAAAQWTVLAGLVLGATVVLHDDSARFDAAKLLSVMEQERVTRMTMVGDAYARPMVAALKEASYDLSSLGQIGVGGAFTSPVLKNELIELLPTVMIIDGYGSSETGGMAFGISTKKRSARSWAPAGGAAVLSADRSRFLDAGDDEVGWTARTGHVPLGYLDDPAQTEKTFPIVGSRRVSVPGDRAQLLADGTITILGRDSMVINTGGEKVFVEEVEEVLRQHDAVLDALVVGRPSERFGEEVVGLVQLRRGASVTPGELREYVASVIARFKAPRAVLICPEVHRYTSGKADYGWARTAALDAVPVDAVAS
jgi:3-oxocholest-4-en-26-oate---CoA ligase